MTTLPPRIGRYRVLDRLGQGAMGTVYRGRDDVLERDVALKVISAERADADARARFTREARAAARLQHPNILTIYELGECATGPFMALELLEGMDLQRAIEAGIKPDPRLTLPVVLQVLAGLGHAHDAGIVHRDVKPSNIFLPRNRPAKVMDFGVARLAGGTTTGGLLVGTANYMSPEQVRAAPDLDGRSDLFSVGLILYELVTGERAYSADSFIAVLYKIANEEPDLGLLPAGPAWGGLRAALVHALAKDPRARYPDAHSMAEDVAAALRALGGRPDPHAAADQILRFSKGSRPATPLAVAPPLAAATPSRDVAPTPTPPAPDQVPAEQGSSGSSPSVPSGNLPRDRARSPRGLVLGLGAATLTVLAAGLVALIQRADPRAAHPTAPTTSSPPSVAPPASIAPPASSQATLAPVAPEPPSPDPTPSPSTPSPTTMAAKPSPAPTEGPAMPPDTRTDAARLERADVLFERGQYAAAAAEAGAVLARDPGNTHAREILEDTEVEIAVLNALRAAREALARGDRGGALVEVRRGLARKASDGRLTALLRELQP